MLLQEASAYGARAAPRGKGKERRSKVASSLNKQRRLLSHFKAGWKRVRDRAKSLIEKFSKGDERRAKASGGEEDISEMGALRADMALEVEEMSREATGRKKSAAARQERLEEEGAAIRNAAVGRVRENLGQEEVEHGQDKEDEGKEGWASEAESRGRKRRRDVAKSFDGEESMAEIERMEEKRREVDGKRLDLEEKRLQKECEEREKDREERREKAELGKQERLAMINLLGPMAESLQNK